MAASVRAESTSSGGPRRVMRLAALAAAASLTACGGGGGGAGAGGGGTGEPVATFTRTVQLPGSQRNWDGGPFAPGGARYQMLVQAADIGGAGPIRSIAFRRALDTAAVTCTDVTIVLGHTSKASLSTTFADNIEEGRGSAVTVLDGPLTIPAGEGWEYFAIGLDEPFLYNGTDNLVIDVVTGDCSALVELIAADPAAAYTALVWNLDAAAAVGSAWPSLAHLKLTFAGGDEALIYPTGNPPVGNTVPFTSGGTRKLQALYLAAEIDGEGPITGVGFPVGANTTTAQTYTVTVRLAHSTRAVLADAYADNYADTPVTVASGATFTVPAGLADGTYVWLPMPDGPFAYNGVDNLVVEIDVSTATGVTTWRTREPVDGLVRLRLGASGGSTGSGISWVPDLTLRFAGGTMDVITPGAVASGTDDPFPFGTTAAKHQYLYLASELGGAGAITGFACRLGGAGTTAATYTGYEVVLSRTAATALTTNFAANLPDPVTVFSGSVAIPGGLEEGDWVEIPFSAPFLYDGEDNLVVQIAGPAGPVANTCALDTGSTTRYANRRLTGGDAAATGTLSSELPDTRFLLQ